MEDKRNIKLFIDKREEGIVQPDRTFGPKNHSDFYVSVFLAKNDKLVGNYVDVYKDSFRYAIDRQNFNPFFVELGLFEKIEQIEGESVNYDLTATTQYYNIQING